MAANRKLTVNQPKQRVNGAENTTKFVADEHVIAQDDPSLDADVRAHLAKRQNEGESALTTVFLNSVMSIS